MTTLLQLGVGYFFFIARANTYSSFRVSSCVLTQEHLGYILPFYVTYPVYMSSSNRDWRDQRPQFKFLHCLWPNERLVGNPTSHMRVLTCIQEWASYGHLEYF